ncbi:MAG: phosphatidate cytidylyltransferase [Alphaproteobacteria bacterium]|nr:phosphatidate cytidylyltransferase [Alphaproteobacteria bacterium]
MKNNLFLRIISALILAPIVLVAIIYGGCTAYRPYDILVAVLGSLMAWEWEKMLTDRKSYVGISLTLMSAMVVFLTETNPVLVLGIIACFALFLYVKTGKNLLLSFGAFYIGLPLLSMMYIAYFSDSGSSDLEFSSMYILWLLFVVWATDVGGYIFGKSIGGPKLCPKISPNKTWAGLLGGMFFSALVTYIFVITMNHYYHSELAMKFLVLSSIALAFISQAGDIFESKIKRYLGIKDSSNLIPGHGGIFDRVDGLLFAAPAVALFVLLTNLGVIS